MKALDWIMHGSHRRAVAFLLGFLVLSLNGPLHLGLDKDHAAIVASFIGGYIGQSTVKELVAGAKKAPPTKDGA